MEPTLPLPHKVVTDGTRLRPDPVEPHQQRGEIYPEGAGGGAHPL